MKTKQLTIYAMLIALTVALSLTILIPVPATNGFVTLCEAGIYTAAFLYGPTGGLVVGASSGLLIDLISGYPQWAVFISDPRVTGYVAGSFSKSSTRMWGLGLLLGSLVMIIGYGIAGWILYDWPAGVASIPGNIFQNLIGMGLAFPITASLQRIQARKQY